MPPDWWKSFVYKSFVTCDDPNGFLECKTIRRSKSGSQKKEAKVEDVKPQKNPVMASVDKEGRGETLSSKRDSASSVQFKEVSVGAQKLSSVVDSGTEESFDGRSVDVAKDLLRGALSLQKSLLMLGKLQESPEYKQNLKKLEKEKYRGRRDDEKGLQRCYSERIGDHFDAVEFQKPRISADGCSRDCYDELREVIRENFARQNLLSTALPQEKACSDRILDLSPDVASASSSQSSMFNSHEPASSDSSSSNLQAEKLRGMNVIAKLMGLEELPSKPVESTPRNQLPAGKLSNTKKPIFDIDLPCARKPSFVVEKERPEQRTLGEIVEIMQFKGRIQSNSYEGSQCKMCLSNISGFNDAAVPVVLLKPMRNSGLQEEFPSPNQYTFGRKVSDNDKMLKLWEIRGIPPRKFDPQNAVKTERNVAKRISQEKRAKDCEEASAMPSENGSKAQSNVSSTRTNASVPVSSVKRNKNEAIEKRVDKIHKMAVSKRQSSVKGQTTEPNSKKPIVSKASNQGKINSTKISISRESTVLKNQAAVPKCPISRSRTTPMLHNSFNRKKNVRKQIVSADKQSSVVVENVEKTEVDVEIKLNSEKIDDMANIKITPLEQISFEKVQDEFDVCAKDDGSIPGDCTVLCTQDGSDVTCNKISKSGQIENGNGKDRISIIDILLSNTSFLNHEEQLLDTISGEILDCATTSTSLVSDCAKEMLEYEHQQWSVAVYPSLRLHTVMRSKISVSFDHLAAEICGGIEYLKSYSKLDEEILVADAINAMLKRDLWGKGTVIGTWEPGWKNGCFSMDEVERVVVQIQELLLSTIIDDVLLDC